MKIHVKARILCGCILGLLCSSTYAQSSVTLYGIIDEGLMYENNVAGGKKIFLDSIGGISSSRIGFTGKEDLGGGLRAIFTLESGINLNNGQYAQGGTAFGRQAFVGLSSDSLGSITFGRQYDMIFYFPEPLTAEVLIGSAVAAEPGDFDNAFDTLRVNNSVRFMSVNYRGLTFGGEYSVGGVAGNFTANSGYSVGAQYATGPFKIAGAFEYFKNPTGTAGSGFFTSNASGASSLAFSLNKAYTVAQAWQSGVVAANYTIGNATLAATYSNVQYANLGEAFLNGTAIFTNLGFAVKYQFRPDFSLAGGYNYLTSPGVHTANGKTNGNQHYNQVSALADYLLSKRTDFYFGIGWQRASGTSSLGTPAVADINNMGDSSGNTQLMVRATFRHRF